METQSRSLQSGPTLQRIFLVEDDPRLASLIREYLTINGYEVLVIPRGDVAAKKIPPENPDLVILDLMLPGQDGLSVCREIRRDYRGPVLILTAREEDMDEVAGLELGADDYVKKPVIPRVLLARIRALLRRTGPPSMPVKEAFPPCFLAAFAWIWNPGAYGSMAPPLISARWSSAFWLSLPTMRARFSAGKKFWRSFGALPMTVWIAPWTCTSQG
jgi:CheY-like chemotaxis protein